MKSTPTRPDCYQFQPLGFRDVWLETVEDSIIVAQRMAELALLIDVFRP